jgi:hypothetical protein
VNAEYSRDEHGMIIPICMEKLKEENRQLYDVVMNRIDESIY